MTVRPDLISEVACSLRTAKNAVEALAPKSGAPAAERSDRPGREAAHLKMAQDKREGRARVNQRA